MGRYSIVVVLGRTILFKAHYYKNQDFPIRKKWTYETIQICCQMHLMFQLDNFEIGKLFRVYKVMCAFRSSWYYKNLLCLVVQKVVSSLMIEICNFFFFFFVMPAVFVFGF